MLRRYRTTALCLVVVCLLTPGRTTDLAAQSAADVLTEHDVARLRSVSQVVASPDGRLVAYTVIVPRNPFEESDGPSWARLHLLNVESGQSRTFIGGDVNVGGVSWSPDGLAILYLARREGDSGRSLHMIPVGGGESTRVLAHATSISSYRCSCWLLPLRATPFRQVTRPRMIGI